MIARKKKAPPNDPERACSAALKTAMNIVAYKDNTERTLRRKLAERGYSPETVGEVVQYMKGKGYLDDGRMLIRTARSLALTKLYGKLRIRSELALKGFDRGQIASLNWESEELCDIDFPALCLKLLEKRGGEHDEKTYAFLRRYGHSPSDIRAAYAALAGKRER